MATLSSLVNLRHFSKFPILSSSVAVHYSLIIWNGGPSFCVCTAPLHYFCSRRMASAEVGLAKLRQLAEQGGQSANGEEWTSEQLKNKENAIRENKWHLVFRFNGVGLLWVIVKINLMLAVAIIGMWSYSFFQRLVQPADHSHLGLPMLFALPALVIITSLLTKNVSRIICIISVDQATKSIYRIGHLTLLGFRRNIFARAGDFTPPNESSEGVTILSRLCWAYEPKKFLLLPTSNVQILDQQIAEMLLGSTERFEKMSQPAGKINTNRDSEKLEGGET